MKKKHNEESVATFTANVTKRDYQYSVVDEVLAASFDFDRAEVLLEQFFSEEDFSDTQDKDPTNHELFLDKARLVHVGGRLGNTNMPFASRFPIYYPSQSPQLKLRVMEVGMIALHAGAGFTRAKDLINILYSDNMVTSVKENALDFGLDTVGTLNDGGFSLQKFSTNSQSLQEELESRDSLNVSEKAFSRVLGMSWCLADDTLSYCKPSKKNERDERTTKVCGRSIFHKFPRDYDLLGILAGVLMPGTAFLSDLCG